MANSIDPDSNTDLIPFIKVFFQGSKRKRLAAGPFQTGCVFCVFQPVKQFLIVLEWENHGNRLSSAGDDLRLMRNFFHNGKLMESADFANPGFGQFIEVLTLPDVGARQA